MASLQRVLALLDLCLLRVLAAAGGNFSACTVNESRRCHGHMHQFTPSSLAGVPDDIIPANMMSSDRRRWQRPPVLLDWDGDGGVDALVIPPLAAQNRSGARFFGGEGSPGGLGQRKFAERDGDANPFRVLDLSSLCGVTASDWNGDGRVDVLTAHRDGSVRYYEHMSDGTLEPRTGLRNPFRDVSDPPNLSFHDEGDCPIDLVDWDGNETRRDLLLSTRHYSASASPGPSPEPLPAPLHESPVFSAIRGLSAVRRNLVDFDGDGDLDLVVRSSVGGGHHFFEESRQQIRYFEHLEDGTLAERHEAANPFNHPYFQRMRQDGFQITDLYFADWDADGFSDIFFYAQTRKQYGTTSVTYLQRAPDTALVNREGVHDPFWGLKVPTSCAPPAAFDWTADGRLDLVLLDCEGQLHYIERLQDGSARLNHSERLSPETFGSEGYTADLKDIDGDGQLHVLLLHYPGRLRHFKRIDGAYKELTVADSPFANILVGGRPDGPVRLVDWNGDGLMDVLDASSMGRYWEQQSSGAFVDRSRAPGSPSVVVDWDFQNDLAFMDWDGDGLLDIVRVKRVFTKDTPVPGLEWYRQLPNHTMRAGAPLPGFDAGDFASSNSPMPVYISAMDWDGDGVQDLIVQMEGTLKVATPGFCVSANPCSAHGSCQPFTGTCECGSAYGGVDCSSCSALHYTWQANAGKERKCTACPSHSIFGACSGRGQCFDDDSARNGISGLAAWHISGDGSCDCSVPGFFGAECDEGSCGAGLKEVAGRGGCALDPLFWLLALLSLLPLSWAASAAVAAFGLPAKVADISVEDQQVVVTTLGNHLLCSWAQPKVFLRRTGHPMLEKATTPYLAKVVDRTRFVLLDHAGEPLGVRVDASQGALVVQGADSLLRAGRFQVPAGLSILVGLLVAWLISVRVPGVWKFGALLAMTSFWIGAHFWRRRAEATPLDGRVQDFRRRLPGAPAGRPCPRGPARAVSAAQLIDFYSYFQSFVRDRNMYYVCANLIVPLTRPEQLSFAELVGPRDVTWFVSHFWGTPFGHFVDSLSKHAQSSLAGRRKLQDMTYWICTLSNNQWKVGDELGQRPEESSFYLALRSPSCEGTAMVLDDEAAALTRSWCLFEVVTTLTLTRTAQASFAGLQLCTASGVLNLGHARPDVAMNLANRLATLRLEDATATEKSDKTDIDNIVEAMDGGFAAVNGFVRSSIQEALLATREAFDGDFQVIIAALGKDGRSAAMDEGGAVPLAPAPRGWFERVFRQAVGAEVEEV